MLVLLTLAGVLAAMLVVGTATAQTSDGSHWAHPTVLHAQMTGEKEAPGPGDPNGFGWAGVILLPPNTVCYALTAHNIAPPRRRTSTAVPPGWLAPSWCRSARLLWAPRSVARGHTLG